MLDGESVRDFVEDNQYDVGWPLTDDYIEKPGPYLKDLVRRVYKPISCAETVWNSMKGSMTGGRPVDLTQPPYVELGDALTSLFRSSGREGGGSPAAGVS
jgi:hypothetical protein